jgi:hypothetical protein
VWGICCEQLRWKDISWDFPVPPLIFPVFKLVPNYRNRVSESISNAFWCVRGRHVICEDSMSSSGLTFEDLQ